MAQKPHKRIERIPRRPWLPQDDARLRRFQAGGMYLDELAILLARDERDVRERLRTLRLPPPATPTGPAWDVPQIPTDVQAAIQRDDELTPDQQRRADAAIAAAASAIRERHYATRRASRGNVSPSPGRRAGEVLPHPRY